MANLVTIGRLPLLVIIIILIYYGGIYIRFLLPPLIILLFLMDWMDGLIARQREEVSELGSILDIAIDRVVETSLWIVFSDIDMVPVWAPLLVIMRGFIVDAIRGYALSKGETPFEMMQSGMGRLLVSSRLSRGLYGFAKVFVFCLISITFALAPILRGSPHQAWLGFLTDFVFWNVVFVVAFCMVRGLPVIIESKRYFIIYPKRKKRRYSSNPG